MRIIESYEGEKGIEEHEIQSIKGESKTHFLKRFFRKVPLSGENAYNLKKIGTCTALLYEKVRTFRIVE